MSRQVAATRGRKRLLTLVPMVQAKGFEVEFVLGGSRMHIYKPEFSDTPWHSLNVHIDWKRGSYRLRVYHNSSLREGEPGAFEVVLKKREARALVEAMGPALEVEDARHRLTGGKMEIA